MSNPAKIGFHFNPTVIVYMPPLISGFLGSDILAAAYAVQFFDQASIVELKELARLAKVSNLSTNSEFQDIFIKNLNFYSKSLKTS